MQMTGAPPSNVPIVLHSRRLHASDRAFPSYEPVGCMLSRWGHCSAAGDTTSLQSPSCKSWHVMRTSGVCVFSECNDLPLCKSLHRNHSMLMLWSWGCCNTPHHPLVLASARTRVNALGVVECNCEQ